MRVTLSLNNARSNISVAAQAPVERALFDQARVLTAVCLAVGFVHYWQLTHIIAKSNHYVGRGGTNHGQLFRHSKSERRCQAVVLIAGLLRGELRKTDARQREHGFENLGHCLRVS